MSAVIAMLLVILPGAPFAAYTIHDKADLSALFRRSVVLSVLLVSLIGWAPLGSHIPLSVWLFGLLCVSLLGLWTFIQAIKVARRKENLDRTTSAIRLLSVASIAIAAAVLLLRPNIDWDAINYYLVSAIDAVLNGHYTTYFSHYVEIANHAPNTVLPAMPSFYAMAIQLAHILKEPADGAIRLIALVFIIGIWLASRRIAVHFLDRHWAEIAGLFALILPGILFVEVANPLLLDLGFSFLILELVALLLSKDSSRWRPVMIGLSASALTIDKIDGLPSFILIIAAFTLLALEPPASLLLSTALTLSLAAAALHVGLLTASTPYSIFIAIAIVSLAFVASVSLLKFRAPLPRFAFAWCALGLIPGSLEILKLVILTGSPAGYYLPNLASHQTALWHEAVVLIGRANVYAPSTQPGIPANFAPGLILWWGFAPPLMIGAIWGFVVALKRREPALALYSFIFIFELAFLTIFGLQDFRHILPVVPLLAITIAYGFAHWPSNLINRHVAIAIGGLSSLPFAWDAQERFFGPPFSFLVSLQMDQWQALATGGLINTLILSLCALGVIMLFCRLFRDRWVALESLYERKRFSSAILVVGAVLVALWFIPVISTGISPGYRLQRQTVFNEQDNHYVEALRAALKPMPPDTILTYQNFGVTWFSAGKTRHAELTDASDLEIMLPALKRSGLLALQHMHITAAILPAPNSPSYPHFTRLLAELGTRKLLDLYSNERSHIEQYGKWYVITPKTARAWQ